MKLEYRNILDKDWLWPSKDRKAWPYLTREENLLFPQKISEMLKTKRSVIQAGGHCGLYPFQYSSLFNSVITFEPESVNFHCLKENLSNLNNVSIYNLGLGNKKEFKSLNLSKKNSGNHMFIDQMGNVEITTIDSFDFQEIDLIHFDLEGYELFALQGAVETIKKNRPLVILETNNLCLNFGYSLLDLDKWMEQINYKKIVSWKDDTAYIFND